MAAGRKACTTRERQSYEADLHGVVARQREALLIGHTLLLRRGHRAHPHGPHSPQRPRTGAWRVQTRSVRQCWVHTRHRLCSSPATGACKSSQICFAQQVYDGVKGLGAPLTRNAMQPLANRTA